MQTRPTHACTWFTQCTWTASNCIKLCLVWSRLENLWHWRGCFLTNSTMASSMCMAAIVAVWYLRLISDGSSASGALSGLEFGCLGCFRFPRVAKSTRFRSCSWLAVLLYAHWDGSHCILLSMPRWVSVYRTIWNRLNPHELWFREFRVWKWVLLYHLEPFQYPCYGMWRYHRYCLWDPRPIAVMAECFQIFMIPARTCWNPVRSCRTPREQADTILKPWYWVYSGLICDQDA